MRWTQAILRTRRPDEAEAIGRALDRMAVAVSGYVGGALAQATIAGVASFTVLTILGVPAPLALAVLIAILDLIPLVGATVGAFLVALVTLFNDFPTVTIIWVIFAIVYQQFENYVVQPRIQRRAVQLDPFVIVVAALFGGTLLGIVGALLAIPVRGGPADRRATSSWRTGAAASEAHRGLDREPGRGPEAPAHRALPDSKSFPGRPTGRTSIRRSSTEASFDDQCRDEPVRFRRSSHRHGRREASDVHLTPGFAPATGSRATFARWRASPS